MPEPLIRSVFLPKNLAVYRERHIHEQHNVTGTSEVAQIGMDGFREEAAGEQGSKRWAGVDQEVEVIKGRSR